MDRHVGRIAGPRGSGGPRAQPGAARNPPSTPANTPPGSPDMTPETACPEFKKARRGPLAWLRRVPPFTGRRRTHRWPGSIGLAPGAGSGREALAEVVAAAAVSDQAKVPCADGKLPLAFLLEQGHQLGGKLREYLAHKRMLSFHRMTIPREPPSTAGGVTHNCESPPTGPTVDPMGQLSVTVTFERQSRRRDSSGQMGARWARAILLV